MTGAWREDQGHRDELPELVGGLFALFVETRARPGMWEQGLLVETRKERHIK